MLTVLTMLTMIYAISVLEWGRHVMLFKKAETGWTEKARSSSLPSLGKDRQLPSVTVGNLVSTHTRYTGKPNLEEDSRRSLGARRPGERLGQELPSPQPALTFHLAWIDTTCACQIPAYNGIYDCQTDDR